jgi:hypothetical protein
MDDSDTLQLKAVSLEEIWHSTSKQINEVLFKSGVEVSRSPVRNKIALAKSYLSSGMLTEEARVVVGHPLFVKVALNLGLIDEILSSMLYLKKLEPLFNELGLTDLLNEFTIERQSLRKLYVFIDNKLEIHSIAGDQDKRIIELPDSEKWYFSPIYYRGMLYCKQFAVNSVPRLTRIDIDSGELKVFEKLPIFGDPSRIGNLIYYVSNRSYVMSFDIESWKVVRTHIKRYSEMVCADGLIYTLKDDILSTYEGTSSPPCLLTERYLNTGTLVYSNIQVIGDRLFVNSMNIYNLEDLSLTKRLEFITKYCDISIYGNKLYVSLTSNDDKTTITIYDLTTYEILGTLVTDFMYALTTFDIPSGLLIISSMVEEGMLVSIYDLESDELVRSISLPLSTKMIVTLIG